METFFQIAFLTCNFISNIYLYRKVSSFQKHQDVIQKIIKDDIEILFVNIQGQEKAILFLSDKITSFPDLIKDDMHRILVELKESLSSAKPIRPNNWDSLKEAFKGPCRVTINERN